MNYDPPDQSLSESAWDFIYEHPIAAIVIFLLVIEPSILLLITWLSC